MATRDALDDGAAALATRSALDVVPAQLWLIVSRGLQAMAAPIIALLIAMGGGGAGTGEEAISFCNVLFVGNLCASGVVGTTFGWRRIVRDLAALPRPVMRELWLFGGLSACSHAWAPCSTRWAACSC